MALHFSASCGLVIIGCANVYTALSLLTIDLYWGSVTSMIANIAALAAPRLCPVMYSASSAFGI